MMLHLRHAAEQGIANHRADSNVVVLTINIFYELGLSKLWIGFGPGKTSKISPFTKAQGCYDLDNVKNLLSSMHIQDVMLPQLCLSLEK